MLSKHNLLKKRQKIDQLRQSISVSIQHAQKLGHSILSSWQRSESAQISSELLAAPLKTEMQLSSTLGQALTYCKNELKHIAEQSSMVVAVGDVSSTIVWSAASGTMQKAAEKVHFIEGGQWREDLVGTNALALSLKTQQSSCVFSNEHYLSSIQDWVCYATPIVDPISKQILGVIDLSTTWNKHNSLGLLAVERCASIIQASLLQFQEQQLFIRAFATPQISFNGKLILLSPRQIEIVCILALCPQGMSLDRLHQALYGERKVSMGTLKAEMSHLREILSGICKGALGSRPYQLNIQVDADFLQAEQALNAGYIQSALELCCGVFLSKTESPFLCAWRDCLESRLSQAIFETDQKDLLMKYLSRNPEAIDAIERLMELIPESNPSKQLLHQYQN